MGKEEDWKKVFGGKPDRQSTWGQNYPEVSLQMIEASCKTKNCKIIDVGAACSKLVQSLLEKGFQQISVLDISEEALTHSKKRLKNKVDQVIWITSDVLDYRVSQTYDIWHDQTVYPFLIDKKEERDKYQTVLKKSLNKGGYLIISVFALDGPESCNALGMEPYISEKMTENLGADFQFVQSVDETHVSPIGIKQKVVYCRFQKVQ